MIKEDNPGVYIPPPLIYAGIFMAAVFLQKRFAIDVSVFRKPLTQVTGVIFLLAALFFMVRSLWQFIQTRNTIIPIKPASSLNTTGIFHITRNPMYLGLILLYLSLTCLIGNWWNIILLPLLLLIVQQYVIKREEKYLARRFGQDYDDYRHAVRRWI